MRWAGATSCLQCAGWPLPAAASLATEAEAGFSSFGSSGSRHRLSICGHMALTALRHVGYPRTRDGNPCLLHWRSGLFTAHWVTREARVGFFSSRKIHGCFSVLSPLRHLLVASCNIPRSPFVLSKLSGHCVIVFLHWGCLEMFVSSLIPSYPPLPPWMICLFCPASSYFPLKISNTRLYLVYSKQFPLIFNGKFPLQIQFFLHLGKMSLYCVSECIFCCIYWILH